MLENNSYYANLLLSYIENSLTVEEISKLFDFVKNNPKTYDLLMETDEIKNALVNKSQEDFTFFSEEISHRMRSRLLSVVEGEQIEKKPKSGLLVLMPKRWIAAAALIFILISFSVYFIWQNKNRDTETAKNQQQLLKNEIIAPQTTKATLTLSNGKIVTIDSAAIGSIAVQGDVSVNKKGDGSIAYNGISSEVTYNTLTVPRGSKPQSLVLADGSKVWINVASSITFPTAFIGNTRKIQITGEAYFEIAKDAARPFKVNVNDSMEIEVLGTHFNVNGYTDEVDIKTSLLEGRIKIIAAAQQYYLAPGQQAKLAKDGKVKLVKEIDTDAIIAWKDGVFQFEDNDITSVMRQLARWYDVDVVYNGVIKKHFNGTISRNVNLSAVLKMLGETSEIKFKTQDKKIIVME